MIANFDSSWRPSGVLVKSLFCGAAELAKQQNRRQVNKNICNFFTLSSLSFFGYLILFGTKSTRATYKLRVLFDFKMSPLRGFEVWMSIFYKYSTPPALVNKTVRSFCHRSPRRGHMFIANRK